MAEAQEEIKCVNPTCGTAFERPEGDSSVSTQDQAKLSGWEVLSLRHGGLRWACPTHSATTLGHGTA